MKLDQWESQFFAEISKIASNDDPAHDICHFRRVVNLAKNLCRKESADENIVVPAAWLHDMVIVPKDSPLRSKASQLSAKKALEFLRAIQYPSEYFAVIENAIEAHSFSANIEAKSLEARIVQDADRLDGLGAIGIARCFATAGLLKRAFYEIEDPFCDEREPNDAEFTIDHFYKKLFKTAETLKTKSGIEEGRKRVLVMKNYLDSLRGEISEGAI